MTTARNEPENLPTDPDALRALVLSMKSERDALVAERDELLQTVERQQHLIRIFNRLRFGRKSERLPEDHRQLGFEDLEQAVDGTLIEAWASMKSFRPKDGGGKPPAPGRNGERDFHGEKRTNDTHASMTDPDARLFRKSSGQASQLCHMGHVLMENRNGLVVDAMLTFATGTAEPEAAIAMFGELPAIGRVTVGGDKLFDTGDFVAEMRRLGVTPHVAQHTNGRRSAIDGRTTRHAGPKNGTRGFSWRVRPFCRGRRSDDEEDETEDRCRAEGEDRAGGVA